MATNKIDTLIAHLSQIIAADDAAPATERRKLPAAFRAEVVETRMRLQNAHQAVPATESQRQVSRRLLDAAYEGAEDWIRSVFARLKGLPPTVNKEALLTSYGFTGGKVGSLSHDHIEALLALFPIASGQQTDPNGQLPAEYLTAIERLKGQIDVNKPLANHAARSERIANRQTLQESAVDLISRTLAYLTYALPQRDRDPRLTDYGFTPRQLPSKVTPAPAPAAG